MDDNDQLTKVTDSVASCYIRTGSLARLLAWLKLLTHLFGATANICENHSTRSTNNCNTTNTHNNEIMRTLLGIFISLLMVGLSASSFMDEVNSLLIPSSSHVSEPLNIGDHAPTSHLSLSSDKASIITFLRHCGCPFAEKQFRTLRDEFASQYSDLEFIAVSHASREDTDDWLKQVGGQGSIKIIIDEPRKIYGEWVCTFDRSFNVFIHVQIQIVVSLSDTSSQFFNITDY